jgi:hypothetical protein
VERPRLDEVTKELCLGPALNPATAVPGGGLLFAMYFVYVARPAGGPIRIDVIRTDTGATIFHAESAAPSSMAALDSFLTSTVPGITAAVSAHPYACRNEFAAVISEDVTVKCEGGLAATNTQYSVDGGFRIEFALDGLDYTQRNKPQSLSGSARVVQGKVTTTLRDTVTRNSPRCAYSATAARTIDIVLQPAATPATYALTIPQDTTDAWQVQPQLGLVPPLLQGPATMQMSMTTSPAANCDAPPGTTSQSTNYRHQELNQMRFTTHAVRPVCGATSPIATPFIRVPNLGVPGAADITSGCSATASAVRFSFQRRF